MPIADDFLHCFGIGVFFGVFGSGPKLSSENQMKLLFKEFSLDLSLNVSFYAPVMNSLYKYAARLKNSNTVADFVTVSWKNLWHCYQQ